MKSTFRIATVAGIPIRVHLSLLLILPLLAVLFGTSFRRAAQLAEIPPERLGGPPWLWGLGVAVGLFFAVLIHELAHSLYAQRRGGRVREIVLFFIGGVSNLAKAPEKPRQEAVMALVGPLVSLAIGGLLLLLHAGLQDLKSFNLQFALFYLGSLNLVVGIFNLLPAFPLDGGRVLRALLVRPLGRVRATNVASQVGKALAVAFAVLGFLSFNLLLLVVAFFVYVGAEAEKRQALLSEVLAPLRVAGLQSPAPAPLYESDSLRAAVERMRRERLLTLPVVSRDEQPVGVLTLSALKRLDPARRASASVADVFLRTGAVEPSQSLAAAFEAMAEHDAPEIPVVADGRLAGVLTQESIARLLALRELAEEPARPARAAGWAWRRREREA